METHAPPRRQLILTGSFALACVLLMIITVVSFGGSLPFAPEGYRFRLLLPDAGNLVPGTDVEISGVTVGRVVVLGRSGNRALATVELRPAYVPLRAGATAIVRTKTLLGETYIELAPGPRSAPPVPDGGMLAASHVLPATKLDAFLEAFAPTDRARLRQLFGGLASALSREGTALNGSLAYSSPFAGDLGEVLKTLDHETPQLQGLFNSSGVVLQALGARSGDLQAAITAGDQVLSTTAERNAQLAQIVRDLPPFLTQLRATSNTITSDSGDLDRAATALLPIAPLVQPAVTAIDTDVPAVKSLFQALPATVAAGRSGLPALTRIVNAIPAAFTQLYPAARQIIPVMQLFATYREEALVAPFANTSSVLNGRMVGPEGKILVRPGFGVYLSNETVAGWVKRLPTNRANPYVTPDGLSKLWTQGFLDSYDCRNIHNPLYLPPLGTGVPPCVTQGPWTYQGKTAYYPRLQAASR